jgi:undecaprenyl diphosphate synthase
VTETSSQAVPPRHIAIIMDGNGRWAARRSLSRSEGHRAGAGAVRKIVTACRTRGIGHLTLYAFSTENWSRPQEEVNFLFELLVEFLQSELPTLMQNDISLRVFGDVSGLPPASRAALAGVIDKCANNKRLCLNLALNYSGREEILTACRRCLDQALAGGAQPDELTPEKFAGHLYSAGQPDPDLIIRTSGELRLSNFLLYQCAYSEFYFTPVLWPDFDEAELDKALLDFAGRKRRFGGLDQKNRGQRTEDNP